MHVLSAIIALLAATVHAADYKYTVAELARAYSADLAVVGDNGQIASAFVARIGKGRYLITNQHVVAGMENPIFTTPERTRLKTGTAAAAEEHDIMSFGIEPDGTAFDVMQDIERHVTIGDDIAVLGNPDGRGVIHPLTGKLVGIGPKLIEFTAEIVPGNSGSPIVHLRTGKVIGVATFLRRDRPNYLEGTTNTTIRRFGYRLDSIKKWTPIRMWDFHDEEKTIRQIQQRTFDIANILFHLRANKSLDPAALLDLEIRAAFGKYNTALLSAKTLPDISAIHLAFSKSIERASIEDLEIARRRIGYDYFVRRLSEETELRKSMPNIVLNTEAGQPVK